MCVLAITKVVKMPFTGWILYGNLERKETPLKSGGEALLNLSSIQTVVLSSLLGNFVISEETLKKCIIYVCLPSGALNKLLGC